MARNRDELLAAGNDLRDDKKWGEVLNKHLNPLVDYRLWPCYGNGNVAWSYHSYFECKNNRYQYYEAEISIVSLNRRWANKEIIKIILALFFHKSNYNRLTALIRIDNRQAVKLVKLTGFILEGIIRKPKNELDILQFSLLREDWERGRFYGRHW